MDSELTLLSNTQFYKYVLQYIYTHYTEQIKSFEYITESNVRPYEYVRRNERGTIKVCSPNDTNFDVDYKDEIINFDLKTLRNENTKTIQNQVISLQDQIALLKKQHNIELIQQKTQLNNDTIPLYEELESLKKSLQDSQQVQKQLQKEW